VDSALLSFLVFQTKVTQFIYPGVLVQIGNAFFQQQNPHPPLALHSPQMISSQSGLNTFGSHTGT